jgi:3'-phosphoadenosine 5'-phosphosulfate sulfotransferase (PAPS reductase)/FAD synthetase
MMEILSLGAGVQSTALLLLSAEGKIPKFDAAIFADTGWEPKAVYEHLDRLEKTIKEIADIPIYRVSIGNIRDDMLNNEKTSHGSMPLYVKKPTGREGFTRRQCTDRYKIRPVQRQVRLLLGASKAKDGRIMVPPKGRIATMSIGISTDEFHRAKDARVPYIKHKFPLLDLNWSREDCLEYLESKGYGQTPKSSCMGCPFHSDSQWIEIKSNPEEWKNVVDFDKQIREKQSEAFMLKSIKHPVYLHQSCKPLSEVELNNKDGRTFSCSPFTCMADEEEFLEPL